VAWGGGGRHPFGPAAARHLKKFMSSEQKDNVQRDGKSLSAPMRDRAMKSPPVERRPASTADILNGPKRIVPPRIAESDDQ